MDYPFRSFLQISRNKIISIILVILILINVIIGSFLFLNIQTFSVPETTITIDLLSINPDDVQMKTTLNLTNKNPFTLIIKDVTMNIETNDGDHIASILLEGGNIPGNQNKVFNTTASIQFKGNAPETLTTILTGTAGVELLGIIQKTLPFNVTMITTIGDILTTLTLPELQTTADLTDISGDGVNCTITIDATNPTPFTFQIHDIAISVTTDTGTDVGTMTITGGSLESYQTETFQGQGFIDLEALDAQTLTVSLDTTIGFLVANMSKELPLTSEILVKVPRIDTLINQSLPTDALIKSDMRPTLRGLRDILTLEIINPNNIQFKVENITFSLFKILNDNEVFIADCVIEQGTIPPLDTTNFTAEILIPYRKLFFGNGARLLPDALVIIVRVYITIEGLNQWFWIGVSGYQDLRIFT